MISRIKQEQVNKILDYVKAHNNIFDKMVVFGVAITDEATDSSYIDIAVRTINDEDATDIDILYDLYSAADLAADGKVDVIIINDPDLTNNMINEINKGEIIYEKTSIAS